MKNKMKLFVIITAVLACISAVPTAELQHPSPVNPNVLVDVKPEEKIILITDPQELAKFKRETKQPLYPTVLPELQHFIIKREHKIDHESQSQTKTSKSPTSTKKPLQKPQTSNKQTLNKHHRRDVESQQKLENSKKDISGEFQKPQILPVEYLKQTSEPTIQQYITQQHKRDIPVPLVPKHHHPEESPKEHDKKETHENKDMSSENNHVNLQTPQTYPLILEQINNHTHHKRNASVPLDPEYHHPEESLKDNEQKEDKNENNSGNHHILGQEQVFIEDYQKPQILQDVFKEKREKQTSLPIVFKRESLGDNNKEEEKQNDLDRHTPQIHGTQVLPVLNHEQHIQHDTVGHHKPQILPVHNHEHFPSTDFQQSQDLPTHHSGFFHTQSLQQPTILPVIQKESADATHYQNHVTPVPVIDHNHEETQKEAYENKYEGSNKGSKTQPNKHEVQIEDLSELRTYQTPVHNTIFLPEDLKPNTLGDHLSVRDFTTSTTTEHPILGHRLVPVV